jgi:5-methylcytosine-specific restriction endonuclease McrA
MSILSEPVLVLNKNWMPIETCTVRRAFEKLFAENARFMNTDDSSLHDFMTWAELPVADGQPSVTTTRMSIRAPEVIVLHNSQGSPKKREVVAYSRRNVAVRDNHTCQYCGHKPTPKELTIDHVHPKKHGGKSTWTNCVVSCWDCNSLKADRPLSEFVKDERALARGLRLRTVPRVPNWSPTYRINSTRIKDSWKHFLPDRC